MFMMMLWQDEPERAIHMLAKMKHLNVKPDIKTYELLYSLFGNVNVPYEKGNILSQSHVEKRIKAIEKDMMKNGIQHSYTSMRNLVNITFSPFSYFYLLGIQ